MNERTRAGLAAVGIGVVAVAVVLAMTGPAGFLGLVGGDDPSTVDIDEPGPFEITASPEATFIGTVDAATGSEVVVRLRSTNGSTPFLMSNATTVDEDGRFVATFDLSKIDTESQATLTVSTGETTIERAIVIEPVGSQ